MSRRLDDLDPRMRSKVFEFLARLVEAQIPVLIVNTLRTAKEQAQAVATGHSKVAHSRHEDGMAIDIVPYSEWQLHGEDKLLWSTDDPVWLTIGRIGESLGFRWGGRFTPLNAIGVGWDPGHVELPARETRSGEVV